MTLKNILFTYLLTLLIFFLIDMVWLGLVAKGFYRRYLGEMLSPKVNWPAAILFYLLFIAGLLLFVIEPAQGRALQALWKGAIFGLIAYATYDLTNLATLKNWPLAVTLVDLVWGTVLGGAVSFFSVTLGRLFLQGLGPDHRGAAGLKNLFLKKRSFAFLAGVLPAQIDQGPAGAGVLIGYFLDPLEAAFGQFHPALAAIEDPQGINGVGAP